MNTENQLREQFAQIVTELYPEADPAQVQIQKTRRDFDGDYTLVVFPLLKASRKGPEATAQQIGERILGLHPHVQDFNVVKGFLNLTLNNSFWAERFGALAADTGYGRSADTGRTVMVEYSSPNTNKPLHLGHIRNNLLGYAVANIISANGSRVIKANLINDRGIHICKSMFAWQRWGDGETPASSGLKGDKLVGKYYVEFDKHYKQEVKELIGHGLSEEDAKKNAPSITQAQDMLRRWEEGDQQVRSLWKRMNGWVYDGFDTTYKTLGVNFDKVYYESETYLLGKELVSEGLDKGIFYRREDGSVWIDLTGDGLDQKLILRADGTSVYMTQDLGTAYRRFMDNQLDELIYVVGNEQNYHFQVLKLILKKLGYDWADDIYHLSYGMVELPEGKMKSREGTVVDADDLIDKMVDTAREMSEEMGKLDGCTPEEADAISRMVGLGALKYFILKVDPRKTMLFDPRESIDFNGNTGPFIQYTHARIRSVLRKAAEAGIPALDGVISGTDFVKDEVELIKQLAEYQAVVAAAGENFSPALICNYVYELAKAYNGFYHDHPILKEADQTVRSFRITLSAQVARVIKDAMALLGIEVPERM